MISAVAANSNSFCFGRWKWPLKVSIKHQQYTFWYPLNRNVILALKTNHKSVCKYILICSQNKCSCTLKLHCMMHCMVYIMSIFNDTSFCCKLTFIWFLKVKVNLKSIVNQYVNTFYNLQGFVLFKVLTKQSKAKQMKQNMKREWNMKLN